MFKGSKFNRDISNWKLSSVKDMRWVFEKSPLEGNEPKWYKK
jgi:surface protein